MAFHKDFSFKTDGDVIAYDTSSSAHAPSLPPGQGLILPFPAAEGIIRIRVTARDVLKPTRTVVDTGIHVDKDGNPIGKIPDVDADQQARIEFNNVAVLIELIPPGQSQPIRHLKTVSGFSAKNMFDLVHIVAATDPRGEWEVRVTNQETRVANVNVTINSEIREPLRAEFLAHRLLDHTYLVLLEALAPSASVEGSTLTISFGEELSEFFPEDAAGPLGTRVISLGDNLSVEGEAHLTNYNVRVGSGHLLLDAAYQHWEKVKKQLEHLVETIKKLPEPKPPWVAKWPEALEPDFDLTFAFAANDRWLKDWQTRVRPDDAVIHLNAAFSDINVVASGEFLTIEADAQAVIRNAIVNVYIAFDRGLERCDVLVLSPIFIEPTDFEAGLLEDVGIIPELSPLVEKHMTKIIEEAGPLIGRYLGEALARLVRRNGIFHSLTSNDSNWVARYTDLPGASIPVIGGDPIHAGTHDPISRVGGVGSVGLEGGVLQTGTGSTPPAPDPSLGVLPPGNEFVVVKPKTLARLDQVDTLVFVMMENRSFDHMLGYLGPSYEGLSLSGDESNRVAGRTQPVLMRPARDMVRPRVTQIPASPNHEFQPVEEQIADGAMSGFAQDFEDDHPGFAEIVMTFYTQEELTVFDELVHNFKVCNHWYCAHAGPTFPNRFVTLTGLTPELDNYAVDDPILGFLSERTIFHVMNERGIKWAVFESDLSIIRMFNRFRLDSSQVRPYNNREDKSQSFVEVAKRGELPEVVFVEPNFADIPPISTANDDHAPADLLHGQNFIAEVVNALSSNKEKWRRTMLVITYDEHGGFYDHVAPPGTRLGRPEFIGKIPRVHPDGQDFMGPRVPSFVVSPLVNKGSVCTDMLDHTSIIKTILLRHRAKIPTRVFTQFGPRVNMIAHLGVTLDLDHSRDDPPPVLHRMRSLPEPSNLDPVFMARLKTLTDTAKPDDFHASLRRAPLPKKDKK